MKKLLSFVPIALSLLPALLLAGCGDLPDEYRLPTQEFAKILELDGRDSGTLFGRILFPSAYTQRSVRFSLSDRTFVSQPDGRFSAWRCLLGRGMDRNLCGEPTELFWPGLAKYLVNSID